MVGGEQAGRREGGDRSSCILVCTRSSRIVRRMVLGALGAQALALVPVLGPGQVRETASMTGALAVTPVCLTGSMR